MESLILRPGMKLVPPRREPIDEARMMTLFGTSSVASDDSVDMTSLVERSTEANGAEPSVALPKPVAVSPSGSVRLFGPLDPPVVLGRTKDLLGEAAYACVLALLQAQGNPLRSKQLDAKAKALRGGVSMCDARKHLLRLITTDPDWAQAIDRPGNSRRGGYVIR
ncbi:MAG TPA: hypothetical protein DCQ98_19265 [Planctomycetaceae bacterium]|nr:hypothetical protein [Planctomycetaceae bacterium]